MRMRLVAGFALFAAIIGACVIAEPATELPTLPEQAPTIVRGSVVPSPDVVLTRWPEKFVVPVRLSNPRSSIEVNSFVDFNPITGEGFDGTSRSDFDINAAPGSTRTLEVQITERTSDVRCHVIEIVVGLGFAGQDFRGRHTPVAPGGDSVTWFYSPGGDFAGCPVFDAKLQPDANALAAIEDAGASTP